MSRLVKVRFLGVVTCIMGIINLLLTAIADRVLWLYVNHGESNYQLLGLYLDLYDYVHKYIIPLSAMLSFGLLIWRKSRTKVSILGVALNLAAVVWVYLMLNPL